MFPVESVFEEDSTKLGDKTTDRKTDRPVTAPFQSNMFSKKTTAPSFKD